MSNRIRTWAGLVAAGLLLVVPCAFANSTVTITISDPPSNNIQDQIYVGSYSASMQSGGDPQVICDDFADETGYKSQTYAVNNFSNLGSTLWGSYLLGQGDTMKQVTNLYDQAAWLGLAMLAQTGKEQGYYSYAIWVVFDPKAVAAWLIGHGDIAGYNAVFGSNGLLWKAENQVFTANEFANFLILTAPGLHSRQLRPTEVLRSGSRRRVRCRVLGVGWALLFRSHVLPASPDLFELSLPVPVVSIGEEISVASFLPMTL